MRFRHEMENCALSPKAQFWEAPLRVSHASEAQYAPGCLPLTLMPPPAGDRPDLADQGGAQGDGGNVPLRVNADGSTDIYFGPKSPGQGKNWLATISSPRAAQKCRRQRGLGLVMQTSKFERRRTIQRCELIVRGATQRFRRRLSKQRTISDRQAPEFPEAVIGSNPCDGCRR